MIPEFWRNGKVMDDIKKITLPKVFWSNSHTQLVHI